MLSVLYLVLHEKLDLPILFLSEHIIYNKNDYYDALQTIDAGKEKSLYDFTLRFLILIEVQSWKTLYTVARIETLMVKTKITIKSHPKLSKIYSHELINYLFMRPYYSID